MVSKDCSSHIFKNFVDLERFTPDPDLTCTLQFINQSINQSISPRVKDPDRGQRPEPEVSGSPGHVQDTQDQPQVCGQSQGMLESHYGSRFVEEGQRKSQHFCSFLFRINLTYCEKNRVCFHSFISLITIQVCFSPPPPPPTQEK